MNKPKFWLWLVILLLLGVTSAALAAEPQPIKPTPDAPTGVTSNAPAGQIESLSGSFVVFDPSVGGDTCFAPGATQTFCFRAESFTNDYEYVYNLWQKFPADWTVSNIYVQGTPACDSGTTWGTFSWSFQTSPYEVNIAHSRYQSTTDHCTAYYCFEVVSGTGAPDALESWYWDGDGYNNPPHWPCSNDSYTPSGQSACDEAIQPRAAIPPCAPSLIMSPDVIEQNGCACEAQEHMLTVVNTLGYDTLVNLSYAVVAGSGSCSGPEAISVPNGGNSIVSVDIIPAGLPGDTVACEVFAVDAANPDNNDTSTLIKHLVSSFFDPAGWQLEPITAATPNQWAGSTVGSNPAAVADVGYVVGGLAAGSSVINPDLQMYDPDTATWTQLADLPNPRFSPVVGWIDGLLYAAGGYDTAFGATNDLQVYDPATDTWDNTTPADMPNIRGGGAGGVGICSSGAGQCLFHVGGGPDSSFANTTLETWEYDPSTNAWTQLDNKPPGSSPDGHILGAGVSCGGYIYVGGDYRGFDEFFRLDATQPSGSQWTQLANIPASAGSMTPALVCKEDMGAIVLIGGDPDGSWGTYNDTVFVYDIATDTWDGPLPQTLHVGQLGSVGWHMYDKVWTAGGTVGSGAISPTPFESLLQVSCDPGACYDTFDVWKQAPLYASNGDVFSYTVTIDAQYLITGFFMVDPLPAGVEYANNLSWNIGEAWYDSGENAVHWAYTSTQQLIDSPVIPVPLLQPDAESNVDLVDGPSAACVTVPEDLPIFAYPEAVLWDNGPLVTHPGACAGMDASRLQTDLGMNTLGFGHQLLNGNRMADDFEVTHPLGWQIDQITFFAYQTNAPTNPSPITGVYYQIWDGPPDDPASSVIFGDLVTNRLLSTTFTDIQRDSGTAPCANNRYIFADVASAGVVLPPGTYWIDWMTDGSLSSGPWAPPITILGQTTTGNALQYTTSSGAWGPALDSGTATQQGMPFVIEGELAEPPEINFDVTVTGHCGDVIANVVEAGFDGIVETFTAATQVSGEALITVSPDALEASLCPNGIGEETFSICNVGDCPLTWEVHEMTPTLRVAGMPLVAQVTLPDEAPQSLTEYLAAGKPAFSVQPVAANVPVAAPDTLTFYNDRGVFDADYPGLPIEGYENGSMAPETVDAIPHPLDEFSSNDYFDPGDILPGIQFWGTVDQLDDEIAVLGEGFMSNPSKTAVANYFTDSYRIVFDPPVQAAGMDLQEFMGGNLCQVDIFGPFSHLASVTSACDEAGVFWGVASDELPIAMIVITSLGGGAEGADNVAFSPMTYADIPWLSQDPISGSVPRGECQDVEVTFDATGLEPGDYMGELAIFSNDLGTPVTTVSAMLNVPEPVFGAAFSWIPATPISGETVDFSASVGGGTPPFDYYWDFDDGTTGTGENVSHVYEDAGTYLPSLMVENVCGVSTVSNSITVEPGTTTVYLSIVVKDY